MQNFIKQYLDESYGNNFETRILSELNSKPQVDNLYFFSDNKFLGEITIKGEKLEKSNFKYLTSVLYSYFGFDKKNLNSYITEWFLNKKNNEKV